MQFHITGLSVFRGIGETLSGVEVRYARYTEAVEQMTGVEAHSAAQGLRRPSCAYQFA
ncbi:MAG: hypothetical protein ACJ8AW_36705 [Rhodopila sp.]